MMTIYDHLGADVIAALNLLEKKGFKVLTNCKVGAGKDLKTGKRLKNNFYGNRYDIVVCMRDVTPPEDKSLQVENEPPMDQPLAVEKMDRNELIAMVGKINGIKNPYTIKTDTLREILKKYQTGGLNVKDYS